MQSWSRISSFVFVFVVSVSQCLSVHGQALSTKEVDYYTNRIGPLRRVVSLTGANSGADSDTLNRIIRNVYHGGGGIITVGVSTSQNIAYLREVDMRNKVQLRFRSNVRLRPYTNGRGATANITMIRMGTIGGRVRDVAITSVNENSTRRSDWFTVQLNGGSRARQKFIDVQRARNFKISGIRITDSNTVFSNIELNPSPSVRLSRADGDIPTDGVIKNIVSTDNYVGYGIVQARAGRRVLFRNLDGEGGVTLRLESGISGLRSKAATIENLVGRDIVIRNGDAAVNLSPHRIDQGRVDVRAISAYNSGFAVQIAPGFLDNKPSTVNNIGVFDSRSVIDNIRIVKGGTGAQIKEKDFVLYPCQAQRAIRNRFRTSTGTSAPGRSIATVRGDANYAIELTLPPNRLVTGTVHGNEEVSVLNDAFTCR